MEKKENDAYIAEKLTYKKESLELYLSDYKGFIESKSTWQVSLSVFITMAVAVISLDIALPPYGFIELVLMICLVISAIVLIYFSIEGRKIDPVADLKDKLFTRYINQPDINSLFISKRKVDDEEQILVYRCKTWGCYFLPYSRLSSDKHEDESKENIANLLDYDKNDIEIEMLLERNLSEKHHPQENVVKEYHSYYFHLYASDDSKGKDISTLDTFCIGKKNFEWKTFEEIEKDVKTQEKNYDVLDILRKNKGRFITDVAPFK